MANRMTSTSRANLAAADRVEIVELEEGRGYVLKAWKGSRSATMQNGDGPAIWSDPTTARRALRRVRKDLEPTSFVADEAEA